MVKRFELLKIFDKFWEKILVEGFSHHFQKFVIRCSSITTYIYCLKKWKREEKKEWKKWLPLPKEFSLLISFSYYPVKKNFVNSKVLLRQWKNEFIKDVCSRPWKFIKPFRTFGEKLLVEKEFKCCSSSCESLLIFNVKSFTTSLFSGFVKAELTIYLPY